MSNSFAFLSQQSKVVMLVLLCLASACSSSKTDHTKSQSTSPMSKLDRSNEVKATQRSSQTPLLLVNRPRIEDCIDDEGNAQVWYEKALDWQACSFATKLFQCKGTLGTEGDGAVVRWALIKTQQSFKLSKTTKTAELQPHVLWTAVIASEEIPSAHAERIYSKTKLIPDQNKTVAQGSCRSFTAQRIQKARSFNLVDARESEFDESTVDELHFEYDQKTEQYKAIDSKDEDFEIKVRSH